MPENRDNIYDPDPGKGFTRAKLVQLQEIKQIQLQDRLQDKLHTGTLEHLKEWCKITKSILCLRVPLMYMIFEQWNEKSMRESRSKHFLSKQMVNSR